VHLNLAFREPLAPQAAPDRQAEAVEHGVTALLGTPPARALAAPRPSADPDAISELAALCRRNTRGLIVCGPAPLAQASAPDALERLAAATGYPILAEAPSQLRFTGRRGGGPRCDAFELVLPSPAMAAQAPEIVLHIGGARVGKSVDAYLAARPGSIEWVLASPGWVDPSSHAAGFVFGDAELIAHQLTAPLPRPPHHPPDSPPTSPT